MIRTMTRPEFLVAHRAVAEVPVKRKKGAEKSRTPVLDNFGRDLTRLAEDGKLDPIVGREKEIERVAQILSSQKEE
jgi:ATP-dependent Clp protease ATP-binding subunit ClpC